jgi:hypothetical protein
MNVGNRDQRLAIVLAIICISVIVLGMVVQWNDHQATSHVHRSVDTD